MTFFRAPFLGLLFATGLVASAWADSIYVPDADFNTIYKPDTNKAVSATVLNGWANFVGTSTLARMAGATDDKGNVIQNTTVTWSDGSTSSANGGVNPDYVDFPSWIGSGAVQQSGTDNSLCLAQNGSERVKSTANLGTIAANTNYTLTADARTTSWSNPVSFNTLYMELLANDQTVRTATPIAVTTSYASYSVTFTAAQLASHVGQTLNVEIGGGGTGDQVQIDNFSLTYQSVPEPTTIVSLASFACAMGLFLGFRRWRQG